MHSRDQRGFVRLGGVMVVPKFLSLDEFDAVAVPSQERLLRSVREGSTVEAPEPRKPARIPFEPVR